MARVSGRRHGLAMLCGQCRAPFMATWSHQNWQRFCSKLCSLTHHNRTPEQRARAAARLRGKPGQGRTHGESLAKSPEYEAWRAMKRRCEPTNLRAFPYYAGRGIAVCDHWVSSFETFLADVGRRPGPDFSLDRIDNDKGYEPSNVRWATWSQQMRNRRPRKEWDSCG